MELPERVVQPREPVISGQADFLVEYTFATGRRWTVILTPGGTSESDLHLPHMYVALAKPDEPNHGSNYFELHMQDKPDQGVVFSIRSNFESVRSQAARENGPLAEFGAHIDRMLRTLLELELAQ